MKKALLWTGLIVSDTLAQLLLKKGALEIQHSLWRINCYILIGYGLYFLSFLLWMQILKLTKLYIALAASSVVYITISLGAHFFLGEPLANSTLLGTLFVATGVFIVGYGKTRKEETNK